MYKKSLVFAEITRSKYQAFSRSRVYAKISLVDLKKNARYNKIIAIIIIIFLHAVWGNCRKRRRVWGKKTMKKL